MEKPKINTTAIDLFVKSNYSSPWQGVVIDRIHRNNKNDIYVILVVKDRNGNIPRKRIIRKLDSAWTEKIQKFDISCINTDWFKLD